MVYLIAKVDENLVRVLKIGNKLFLSFIYFE